MFIGAVLPSPTLFTQILLGIAKKNQIKLSHADIWISRKEKTMKKHAFKIYVFLTVLLLGICVARSQNLKAAYQFPGDPNTAVEGIPGAAGGLDGSFSAGVTDGNATGLTSQPLPDGKILVGGTFTLTNGVERAFLARLNGDGSFDTPTSVLPSAS
jgi:hypothetical protein